MQEPKIFIASSSEQLPVVRNLILQIGREAFELYPWYNLFNPSEYPLESLENQLLGMDFAIFVFSPDDTTLMRNKEYETVRDNVILEYGYCVGLLGRARCLVVVPKDIDVHLPTDMVGLTPLKYDSKKELRTALVLPAAQIVETINNLGPREKTTTEEKLSTGPQTLLIVSDEKTEFISSPNWPKLPKSHPSVIAESIHWARWNLPEVEGASWIADRKIVSNQEAIHGGQYNFRRVFEVPLKSIIDTAILHFIVDDWVDFGLNGNTVINFEEDTRLVNLDVTKHIREGKNEIFLKVRNRSFEDAVLEGSQSYNPGFANKINKYEDNPYGIRFKLDITYSRRTATAIEGTGDLDVDSTAIRSSGNIVNLSFNEFWEPTNNEDFELAICEALLYDKRDEHFELIINNSELNSLWELNRQEGQPRNPSERRTRLERSKRILELEQRQKWIRSGLWILFKERALKGLWLADEVSHIIAVNGYLRYYNEKYMGKAQGAGFDIFRRNPDLGSGIYLDLHERSELCSLWDLPDNVSSLNAMVGHNPLSDLPSSIVTSKAIPAIVFEVVDYEVRKGDMLPFEQSSLLNLNDWGFGLK